jgi:hypothetical protein
LTCWAFCFQNFKLIFFQNFYVFIEFFFHVLYYLLHLVSPLCSFIIKSGIYSCPP